MKTVSRETKLIPPQITLESLFAEARLYLAPRDLEGIQHAYDLANEAHGGVVRRSGEPYIQHPLAVALLVARMQIDADGIIAALLHDVVEDTHYSLEELSASFGPDVASIVDGVTKFDAIAEKQYKEYAADARIGLVGDGESPPPVPIDKRRQRTETVRKMMLAMAEDPRVVILKLADRLHNMRTLSVMKPDKQERIARETSEIFVPLARRLGMALVQWELEDLVLSILEPEKYAWLVSEVEAEKRRRQPYLDEVCRTLSEEMQRAGIHAEVGVRWKNLASIKHKLEDMPRQQDDGEARSVISQIHDIVSFRILVDTDHECYLSLGHIHALWRPTDGRIKDYIATPKFNGYQSLHTTVFCLNNLLAEIQIRTYEMQRTADYGIASYWYLRERVSGKDENSPNSWRLPYREMVSWIKQLREWQRALPQSADEFVEAVKGDIFQEQIFVFTPKGEVKDLPRGSTPLDMAYRIHTDLGDHCAGARIITNMDDTGRLVTRLVPLDYELKGGEIVDIMVNRTAHPTRDWLSFARTAAARTKIRRYLKTYEREINLQLGHERLDMALKAIGTPGLNAEIEMLLQRVHTDDEVANDILQQYATLEDVYVALGREDLLVEQILGHLMPFLQQYDLPLFDGAKVRDEKNRHHKEAHEVQPLHIVSLASCCCPIPGDTIVGALSPRKGMQVHRRDCRVLKRRRSSKNGLVDVNWLQVESNSYLTPVTIVAHDRSGLLRDVAAVVADAGVNMTMVTSMTNTTLHKAVITATLEIDAANGVTEQMERIFRRLRQVKNVISVERAV